MRELALSKGGLLHSDLRRRAWPKLLGLSARDIDDEANEGVISKRINILQGDKFQYISESQLDVIEKDLFRCHFIRKGSKRRCDYDVLDRERFKSLDHDDFVSPSTYLLKNVPATPTNILFGDIPPSSCISYFVDQEQELQRFSLGDEDSIILTSIIIDVLQKFRGDLHYYQGFHNIAAVMLLNLSSISITISVLQTIAQSHLSEAMQANFNSLKLTTEIFFPLIRILDRPVFNFFIDAEIEPSIILSWMITWFSHEVTNLKVASRLFDCFLSSHPLFPMYLFSSVILLPRNRSQLLDTEPDFATIHMKISDLFKNLNKNESTVDLEAIIKLALSFM